MERLQRRLDRVVLTAAVVAVPVALAGILGSHDTFTFAVSVAVWLVFLAEATIMLRVSPSAAAWARTHKLELTVLVLAFPLWPLLATKLYYLELAPALEIGKLVKVAKVVKAVRIVRRRRRRRSQVA
jgi:hypothetical protein